MTDEERAALKRHARFGHDAMRHGTPDYGQNDADTDAVDTIANILHARSGSDPADLCRRAIDHFKAEVWGEA